MKKTIAVFLTVLTIFSLFAFCVSAKEKTVNGFTFRVIDENCIAITGYDGNDTSLVVPETIGKRVVLEINDEAFAFDKKITSVSLPKSVKTIGDKAFCGCTSLKTVALPEEMESVGVGAFENCISLETVNIPSGISAISETMFSGCENLKCVVIPDDITFIGDNAFENCKSLSSLSFGKSVKTIMSYAFYGCTALESVKLPNSVKKIFSAAFAKCSALEEISMPTRLQAIDTGVFADTAFVNDRKNWTDGLLYLGNCLLDTKVKISGSVKVKNGTRVISPDAFNKRKKLTSVYIPKTVRSFNLDTDYLFWECPALEKITVNKENNKYSSVYGVLYNKKQTTLLRYPSSKSSKKFTIPESVKKIGFGAFEGSVNLTEIKFNNKSRVTVGSYSLYNCKSVKTMTIPKNVKIDEDSMVGWYTSGHDEFGYPVEKKQKGFVLKGYADTDASRCAAMLDLKFESLCKNSKAHKTVNVSGKKATYFENGYKQYKRCTVCGEKIGFETIEKKRLKTPEITLSVGSGKIKVKYTAVKDAAGFQVKCVDSNGNKTVKSFKTTQSTTVTIGGLPDGKYKVYVRAFIKDGDKTAYSAYACSKDGKVMTAVVK